MDKQNKQAEEYYFEIYYESFLKALGDKYGM